MKTNAILAGIAMSLLLLVLPAAASDYTLGIFGNANEDETINMQDVTYTELIILEYKDATQLADAKYDDKINMQDVTQIELIILGREKELTILDSEGESKTISMPVNEILTLNSDCTEAIRAIGAKDRIVGIESATATQTTFFPEISALPSVGKGSTPDLELVVEIDPDILIAYAPGIYNPGHDGLEDMLEPAVTVVRLNFYKPETVIEDLIKLGYLLGEVENARNYIEWRDEYVDEVEDVVSGISEDDKPRVFIDYGSQSSSSNRITAAKGTGLHQMCVQAGGINIAADLPASLAPGYPYVELEWILDQEPTVVIGQASGYNSRGGGYETDDDSDLEAYYEEIIGLSGFGEIPAVKNNRIYIMQGVVSGGLTDVVGLAYYAEWFHPDIFAMDAQAIHQEYIDEFCGIDFDVAEHGVFVYSRPEES
jgi:iron complex transport system substrate-binding protein